MKQLLLATATLLLVAYGCKKEAVAPQVIAQNEVKACGWDQDLEPTYKQQREMLVNLRYNKNTPVILLDTNGYYCPQSSWMSGSSLNVGGSGLDSAELQVVIDSVRSYYRQWEVNVTFDESIYNSADPYHRGRVVLTQDWQWYGLAGGVAYINSFTWGDDTPCFVFTTLLSYKPKLIGVAAAHEAGHMLGLQHQSVCNGTINTAEYNPGNSFFAPIMGLAYYTAQPSWWIGTNSWCQQQDDVTIISSVLKHKRKPLFQ